jgi:hypothetical protein
MIGGIGLKYQTVKQRGCPLRAVCWQTFSKGLHHWVYIGPIMWTCPIPGTEKPSDDHLAAQGVLEDSEYALCVKNKDCVWQLVDPKPVAKEPGSPLYLGGHYQLCIRFTRISLADRYCRFIIRLIVLVAALHSVHQNFTRGPLLQIYHMTMAPTYQLFHL